MRKAEVFKFHFRNGSEWEVSAEHIGDLWIKRVSNSLGRINGGEILEINPAESLKVEILPDADTFQSESIDQGGLETGMFETITRNRGLEWVTLIWSNGQESEIYFPFEPVDEDGLENKYMSSKVGEDGHLYIVIDEEKNVSDIY